MTIEAKSGISFETIQQDVDRGFRPQNLPITTENAVQQFSHTGSRRYDQITSSRNPFDAIKLHNDAALNGEISVDRALKSANRLLERMNISVPFTQQIMDITMQSLNSNPDHVPNVSALILAAQNKHINDQMTINEQLPPISSIALKIQENIAFLPLGMRVPSERLTTSNTEILSADEHFVTSLIDVLKSNKNLRENESAGKISTKRSTERSISGIKQALRTVQSIYFDTVGNFNSVAKQENMIWKAGDINFHIHPMEKSEVPDETTLRHITWADVGVMVGPKSEPWINPDTMLKEEHIRRECIITLVKNGKNYTGFLDLYQLDLHHPDAIAARPPYGLSRLGSQIRFEFKTGFL